MNSFERFVHSLQTTTSQMVPYGWFHLMFIGIMIFVTVILCILCKNSSNKTHKWILFSVWLIIFGFEMYKQLVFAFDYESGVSGGNYWNYDWYSFPFQFCSTPIYILPFAILLKNEKATDYFESFLSTYCLFAGICVMLYPNTVFNTDLIGVAIQTMVHHSLMVVLGIYLVVRNRNKLDIKYFLKGILPFLTLLIIAFTLNETIILITDQTFNMFFISRHFEFTLPIFNNICAQVPYIVFLCAYIFGFTFCAFLVYAIVLLIKFIINKIVSKRTYNL